MRKQRAPILFPITLVLLGIVILLNSFLLIDADVVSLWPILLIIIALQVLWRGDLAPSWQAQTFGITRGSVESASLEISSAEIDVRLTSLQRAGRLISGAYTARSRPRLAVRNNHANLVMRRGQTWLFSLADWDIQLTHDVPWVLLMSAHLGELKADLRGIVIERAYIASGIGDIDVTAPDELAGLIDIRSTFGDIHLTIPEGVPALIRITASPMCRVITDDHPFETDDDGEFYATPEYVPDQPALNIQAQNTFGNVLLSIA